MDLVSVIIPTYKRTTQTVRAVQSALAQVDQPVEVIVVDDCSPEADFRALEQALAAFTSVKLMRAPRNGGAATARNIGADAAKGPYIAFLDSDDLWYPDKLARQMAVLRQSRGDAADARPVLVFSSARLEYEIEGASVNPTRAPAPGERMDEYMFVSSQDVQTSGWLMLKQDFDRVRFTNGLKRHQDLDFVVRAQAQGFRFRFTPGPLYDRTNDSHTAHVGAVRNDGFSAQWLRTVRPLLTNKAYHRFRLNVILPKLGRSDWLEAFHLWLAAALAGERSMYRLRQYLTQAGFLRAR